MTIGSEPTKAPRVSAKGRAALAAFLDESVNSGRFPAQFHGIATADDLIYWDKKGDLVYGDPEKGQVNDDTSTCSPRARG